MTSFSLAARLRLLVTLGVVLVAGLVCASVAPASSLTESVAARAAKRAAARHVQRLGTTTSSREWAAFCLSWAPGTYSCTVATRGGQCHGRLVVYGSREHPRTRSLRIGCGE